MGSLRIIGDCDIFRTATMILSIKKLWMRYWAGARQFTGIAEFWRYALLILILFIPKVKIN